MLRSVILACLLVAIGSHAGEDIALASPRLQRLRNDAAARPGAVADFWTERAAAGAPMIESIAGDVNRVLVTFLWRGVAGTKNVYVIAFDQGQYGSVAHLNRASMSLLPGTDVWFRTYRMPCDL